MQIALDRAYRYGELSSWRRAAAAAETVAGAATIRRGWLGLRESGEGEEGGAA